jgi:succinate dehydrogenase cytochrome b subunit
MTLWRSTIGKKYVAAVTGALLALFVVLHMLGNLKAIEGPGHHGNAAIDRYAHFLRTLGSPVLPHDFFWWTINVGLILTFVLHLTAITHLYVRNRRSKPRGHKVRHVRATLAARTMPLSGALLLAFLIFHILQFTTLTIHPSQLAKGKVYANMYGAFHLWWVVVIYVGAVGLLGLHINHGLWSGTQTAGIDNPDRNWMWRRLATGVTLVTVAGFVLVPLLFAFGGLPKPPPGFRLVQAPSASLSPTSTRTATVTVHRAVLP